MELNIEIKDWIMISALILGPILAVQAQKIIENITDRKRRKIKLFHILMETRATRLSVVHVSALNMIDLEFYGKSLLGKRWQSKFEKRVTNAWKIYNDHLNSGAAEDKSGAWGKRSTELFTVLLYAMAQSLGYDFDEVQLKRDFYSPVPENRVENEQNKVREAILALLEGNRSLPMHITSLPQHHPIDPPPQPKSQEEASGLEKMVEPINPRA